MNFTKSPDDLDGYEAWRIISTHPLHFQDGWDSYFIQRSGGDADADMAYDLGRALRLKINQCREVK